MAAGTPRGVPAAILHLSGRFPYNSDTMTGYIIRRVLWMIPVLWAVATITFLLMHAVPGGPFSQEKELPPAVLANLNKKYDLAKPLYEKNGGYLGNLATATPGR